MPRKNIRIIIDTNLWISFLLTSNFKKLDLILTDGLITLIFSENLLNEFTEVILRPKFRKYFSEEILNELLILLEPKSQLINVTTTIELCRDPKDNFLLELANDGKADYLITGDKDLLTLKRFEHTQIITMTDFLNLPRFSQFP